MRPSIVITIAILLLGILGAAALQFLVLAPNGNGPGDDGESGLAVVMALDV